MSLYKKLDFWSVSEGVEEVMDYYIDGNLKESPYWDFYSDQINELGAIASDMYNEIGEIREKLRWMGLPVKNNEFYEEDEAESFTEISWWNTACCMLSDTDMIELVTNENPDFCGSFNDYNSEKNKRIKSFEKLTKKQQMNLYTLVLGFIERYKDLRAAFEVIKAVINELDYHQSAVQGNDKLMLPESAYL